MTETRITCTRKITFDAAHRVMLHESKCRHLHGHTYVAEVTAHACRLDDLGRVVDFSVIKKFVGGWIDEHWDHGTIVNGDDTELRAYLEANNMKHFVLKGNPTAEIMAEALLERANSLLMGAGVTVTHVRLHETPNCWADARKEEA